MTENDWQIIKRCLGGETVFFEQLIDKYQKHVFNVAFRMVNNFNDAEDITQTVFVKAYENLRSFNPKYKFFSWVYRMAINEAINLINKKKPLDELDNHIANTGQTQDDDYEQSELSKNIQTALMDLKPEYREVIVLKHLQGLSYKETSRILNIPEKTVKSRLFSARRLLKDILVKKGFAPE